MRATADADFPANYRYLADEWLPGGWYLDQARQATPRLAGAGLAYLSVMGGCYESFQLPERQAQDKRQGYMADLAATIKSAVDIPVSAAGRIQEPAYAEELLAQGRADLIGLVRVLLADPLWPRKAPAKAARPKSCPASRTARCVSSRSCRSSLLPAPNGVSRLGSGSKS